MTRELIVAAGRIVTCDPARAAEDDPLGIVRDGAILIRDGAIAELGPRTELLAAHPALPVEIDAPDAVLTPGLVDSHTHLPWVGSRDREYALRMRGADYEEIAKAGGGIVSSMRSVRDATQAEIVAAMRPRAERMAALGVTTLEAKTGYGLDERSERMQLCAIGELAESDDLPRVVPTYLALHALPPEAAGDRDGYAQRVAGSTLDSLLGEGIARYVDAYIDRSAFSVAQARPVLERAVAKGLGLRLHVGQFADVGGAELAAELGAASVDHLEQLSESGATALASAGIPGALLPVASFTLSQEPPPVERMRAAGMRLLVASDANPGTAPTESLPLAMALAVRSYGLTVDEVLLGTTRHAAESLGLETTCGALATGLRADLVVWDFGHESALIQPWGTPRARTVMRDGRRIAGSAL